MINVEIKLNLNEKWINPEVGDILRSEDGRTGIYLGDHPSMVLPGDFYVLQIGIITKPKTLFFPKIINQKPVKWSAQFWQVMHGTQKTPS